MTRKLGVSAKDHDHGKQQKWCCKRSRNIALGFWIGLAGAVVYANNRRKPVFVPTQVIKGDVSTKLAVSHSNNAATVPPVTPSNTKTGSKQRDFREIGRRTGTDKVWGADHWEYCEKDQSTCDQPNMVNPKCRVLQGHFYHTMYNRWLGPYSTDDTEPFQFLEIGHYEGYGFDAYKEFLPRAETHSIEIACIEAGPREEGKWPFGNFPSHNPKYQEYLDTNQLHCGDGTDYDFLTKVWTQNMKRPGAPPLKVVIDDASHLAEHMATSLLFWFPKIEPGGILVVEDVQPIPEANDFRTHVVPQVLKDLHYCGDPSFHDKPCFPTVWKLLQSVHCEMHICVFERNDLPSLDLPYEELMLPPNTLDGADCLLRSTPV